MLPATQTITELLFAYNQRGRAASRSVEPWNNSPISTTRWGSSLVGLGMRVRYIECTTKPGIWWANMLRAAPWCGRRRFGWVISLLRRFARTAVQSRIYYVHADHLGTPRKVTRPSDNKLVWSYDPATFGTPASVANQNPSGLGTFLYDLRFPGQLYLGEDSGYRDNGFRRFDSWTGRYLESDPIGLRGGSDSTYAYVDGNPLSNADPLGLQTDRLFRSVQGH